MKNIILILCVAIGLFGNTLEIAKELFDKDQKYSEALQIFQNFPDDGEALWYIGNAYYYGKGVEKDSKKSFEYIQKSANKNYPNGLIILGAIYEKGTDVEQDEIQALMYYKQAANLGSTLAMINIGHLYLNGNIVKQDLDEAKKWFLKSIELGDIKGYLELGDMYFNTREDQKALEWYLKYEKAVNYRTWKEFDERVSSLLKKTKDFHNSIRIDVKRISMGIHIEAILKEYQYVLQDEQKNYLFSWLEENKNNNNSNILISLGYLYHRGFIVEKDISIAEGYYLKALEAGNTIACLSFGDMYFENNENKKALKWYIKYQEISGKPLDDYASIRRILYLSKVLNDQIIYKKYLDKYENLYNKTADPKIGCDLASELMKVNSIKSYDLALEIIFNNEPNSKFYKCYKTLGVLKNSFTSSDVAKNYEKSMHYSKLALLNSEPSDNFSSPYLAWSIASIYKNQYKDYENAKKWFQKAYDFSNDLKYLQEIENLSLLNSNSKIVDHNSTIPFLNHYSFLSTIDLRGKDRGVIETNKYYFFLATNGYIKMYDKSTKRILKEFRTWINPQEGFAITNMAFDEKKNYLYYTIQNSNLMMVLDINKSIVVDTIKYRESFGRGLLKLSIDGKLVVFAREGDVGNVVIINTQSKEYHEYYFEHSYVKNIEIVKADEDYLIYLLSSQNMLYTYSYNKARKINQEEYQSQITFKNDPDDKK